MSLDFLFSLIFPILLLWCLIFSFWGFFFFLALHWLGFCLCTLCFELVWWLISVLSARGLFWWDFLVWESIALVRWHLNRLQFEEEEISSHPNFLLFLKFFHYCHSSFLILTFCMSSSLYIYIYIGKLLYSFF